MKGYSKDYYTILGVDSSATQDQIRSMYKRLAKKYHVDTNGDDPVLNKWSHERMVELNEAYSVLKNPVLKSSYDIELEKKENEKNNSQADKQFVHIETYQQGIKFLSDLVDNFPINAHTPEQKADYVKKIKKLIKRRPRNYLRLGVPHTYEFAYLKNAVELAFTDAFDFFELKVKRQNVYFIFSILFVIICAFKIFSNYRFSWYGIFQISVLVLFAYVIYYFLANILQFIARGLTLKLNRLGYIAYGSIAITILALTLFVPLKDQSPKSNAITPNSDNNQKIEEKKKVETLSLKLKNESSEKISVAISYINDEEVLETQGWWEVEPQGISLVNLETASTNLYFYAMSKNGLVWSGEKNPNSVTKKITSDVFKSVNSYDIKKSNSNISFVKFYPVTLTRENNELIHTFSIADESFQPFHDIKLKNDCSEAISVAIHYLDSDKKWTTTGWYTVDSKSTIDTPVRTKNGALYFFAESANGLKWNSNKTAKVITLQVSSDKFTTKDNVGLTSANNNVKYENFFETNIPFAHGPYTQGFNCD